MRNTPCKAIPLLLSLLAGCASVGSGQAGVLWRSWGGTQPRVYGEGKHAIGPQDKMYIYDLRSLTRDEPLTALAGNGVSIKLNASVRYHVLPREVVALQEQIGPDYYDKVLRPLFGSEARRVLARYSPEEIYATKRAAIESEITAGMCGKLTGQHIALETVLLRAVELPATLRAAIDKKAVTEQLVHEQRYLLSIAKSAAEQKQIEAQGLAEYNRTIKPSLSQEVLQYERIRHVAKLAASPNGKVVVMEPTAAPAQVTVPAR